MVSWERVRKHQTGVGVMERSSFIRFAPANGGWGRGIAGQIYSVSLPVLKQARDMESYET